MIDTQADITLIKINVVKPREILSTENLIDITGITDYPITTLGCTEAELSGNEFQVNFPFHVVPEHFNIPADGIIGKDFMKKFRCNIDYNSMSFSFFINDRWVSLPILEGPTEQTIVLPARSEVTRQFMLREEIVRPRFVCSQELKSGVFVARTIIDTSRPLLKLMNTTDKVLIVRNDKIQTESMTDYDVFDLKKMDNTEDRVETLMTILKDEMPEYCQDKLLPLCREFADVFALETDAMTVNNFYTQKLRLKDDSPAYVKNYRTPHSQKEEIKSQVEALLKNDFIEPSASDYNSPLLLVPKPSLNGKKRWRLCLDYRQVNKRLIADKFPLPRIDEILDNLGKARCFSKIDLFQGFWQIPLDPASRDITSFSTNEGSFRWKVLPFGLSVSPNSFSRMMAIAFSGIPPDRAFLYIDDIIVIGRSEEEHLRNLKTVFATLRKRNLKIHPRKCQFFRPEVTFLGHLCTPEGILPDPSKRMTIINYPVPSDKDATKRFVAFANYYRRFIKDFSLLTKPLSYLTKKHVQFKWNEECDKNFSILKEKLLNPPILRYPDFDKQFVVTVDASAIGCGAVLSQLYGDDDLPIAFVSKAWSHADAMKSTPVQECLGIHYALSQFRPYVYGTSFLVRTDHRSLIYLFTHKNLSPKLLRIRLDLEEYDFTIEHVSGKKNVVADALSRIRMQDIVDLYGKTVSVLAITRSMSRKKIPNEVTSVVNSNGAAPPSYVPIFEELSSKKVRNLPTMKCAIDKLKTGKNSNDEMSMIIYKGRKQMFKINVKLTNHAILKEALLSLENTAVRYNLKSIRLSLDDLIFRYVSTQDFKNVCNETLTVLQIILIRSRMQVLEKDKQLELLTFFHNDKIFGGHSGQKRLYARLRSQYTWKNMRKDVARFVKGCSKCQLTKVVTKNKEPLFLTETPQKPFDLVVIDTIGPLPISEYGNKYAITMICDLSKYLVFIPIPNKEAPTVAKAILSHFILIYGLIKKILTDLGTEYINSVLDELCTLLQMTHNKSTAYHHQTVGTAERSHRTFNEYVRAYIANNILEWEDYSRYFTFCYNISQHSSFQHTYSPYELVFCKTPVLPFDWLNGQVDPVYNFDNFVKEAKYKLQSAHIEARRLIDKMKRVNKSIYDKNAKPLNLKVNDMVKIVKAPYEKHEEIYAGPFTIRALKGSNVEIIDEKTKKTKLIHKDRVRKYVLNEEA